MRFVIQFSYDGSGYWGYQKQKNKQTIQQTIEDALFKIFAIKTKIVASGRTDTGVHAINQYAHFDLDVNIEPEKLKIALNHLLPNDIYIKKVSIKPNFHARFDVKKKEYQYIINTGKYNVFENKYVYQYNQDLDVEKMEKAAQQFLGTHDFTSFCKKNLTNDDYQRTIFKIKVQKKEKKVFINIIGSGFLRYMVRNMVGCLIEVGNYKQKENIVPKLLKEKNRQKAGIKAPAEGLYLKRVYY